MKTGRPRAAGSGRRGCGPRASGRCPIRRPGRTGRASGSAGGGSRPAASRPGRAAGPQGAEVPPRAIVAVRRRRSSSGLPGTRTRRGRAPRDRRRLMLLVVVAQDRVLAQPGLQRREHGLDPGDRLVVLDQVAGQDDQVGLPVAAGVDHPLEVTPVGTGREMKVGELDDRQAVERLRGVRGSRRPTRAGGGGTTRCRAAAAARTLRPAADQRLCAAPGRAGRLASTCAGDPRGPPPQRQQAAS